MKNLPLLLAHCSELFSYWLYRKHGIHAADKIAKAYFRERHYLGSKDRRFVRYLYYDMIRNLRLYRWQTAELSGVNAEEISPELLTVHACKRRYPEESRDAHFRIDDKIAGYFREYRYRDIYPEDPAVRGSVPGILWEKIKDAYPRRVLEACFMTLNRAPAVHLRVNTLKTQPDELRNALRELHPENARVSPSALRLGVHRDLSRHPLFLRGFFEFQDESSQLAAYACCPRPDETVADICAGGGGKSLHLSALMNNKGSILATDRYPQRLGDLRKRLRRSGSTNIRILPKEKLLADHRGRVDVLLADAPCSGSGVYRRAPDTKWDLTEAFLRSCVKEQTEILNEAAEILRPGGRLVYATCSIIPEENEDQIERFLREHPAFEPHPLRPSLLQYGIKIPGDPQEHMLQILPQDFDSDGFFIAVMWKRS